jgi:hypothetical protein
MQPPDIQAIIAAILTLAATPLQDRQPGTTPEALGREDFYGYFSGSHWSGSADVTCAVATGSPARIAF